MISIINSGGVSTDKRVSIVCNSTDIKPTDSTITNGSLLTETDTGDMYVYDEASASWTKFSGGGSSPSPVLDSVYDPNGKWFIWNDVNEKATTNILGENTDEITFEFEVKYYIDFTAIMAMDVSDPWQNTLVYQARGQWYIDNLERSSTEAPLLGNHVVIFNKDGSGRTFLDGVDIGITRSRRNSKYMMGNLIYDRDARFKNGTIKRFIVKNTLTGEIRCAYESVKRFDDGTLSETRFIDSISSHEII